MVLVAVVIFGGVKTIAAVCERLVPVMAVAYAGGCIVILALNAPVLGEAIGLIFETAFTGKAAFGGAVGSGVYERPCISAARAACSPTSRAWARRPSWPRRPRHATRPSRRSSP